MLQSSYSIPYVDPHVGPRRLLSLDLRAHAEGAGEPVAQVAVDGRWYTVVAGLLELEVPADRPVQVSMRPAWAPRRDAISVVVRPEQTAIVRYQRDEAAGVGALALAC